MAPLLALLLLLPACLGQDCADCEQEESSLLALRPTKVRAEASFAGLPDRRACLNLTGIFWRLDGAHGSAASLDGWQPLEVPQGGRLSLLACNVENRALQGAASLSSAPPALLAKLGEGARAKVTVLGSFNADVNGSLSLTGNASLMPLVLAGEMGANARVKAVLQGSGNVRLAPESRLEVGGGAGLLGGAVAVGELSGCEVRVTARHCGSVEAQGGGEVQLQGALLAPALRAGRLSGGAEAKVRMKECGSVAEANASVTGGWLLRTVMEVEEVHESSVEVEVEMSGKVKGGSARVEQGGNLLQGLFDATGAVVNSSSIVCKLAGSALLEVERAQVLGDAKLLAAVLSVPSATGAKASVELQDSANVECGEFEMEQARLFGEAVTARGSFREGSEVRASIKRVASVDARVARLQPDAALGNAVVGSRLGTHHGVLDVELADFACVKAGTVSLQNAWFIRDVLRTSDSSDAEGPTEDSEVTMSIVRSFNVAAEGNLSLKSSWLVSDVIDERFVRCKVSLSILESMNVAAGGDWSMEDGAFIYDVQDGSITNTSFRLSMLRSVNTVAKGNMARNGGALIYDVIDGSQQGSSMWLSLVESACAHVQGDVNLTRAYLISDVVDSSNVNDGFLSLQARKTGNLYSEGNARLTSGAVLISDFLDGSSSECEVEIDIEESALLQAAGLFMEQSFISDEIVDGMRHVNSRLRVSARDFANVRAGRSAFLESSVVVQDFLDDDLDGSRLQLILENVANVVALAFTSQATLEWPPGAVLEAFVRAERVTGGSELSVRAIDVANVRAASISLNSSAAVLKAFVSGDAEVGFSNSSASLKLQRVAGLHGQRVTLDASVLLGPLFELERSENAELKAELEDSAILEATSAELLKSSLLGNVVSGSAQLKALVLENSAVVCDETKGVVRLLENSTLCADGLAALAKAELEDSCEAQFCRLRRAA